MTWHATHSFSFPLLGHFLGFGGDGMAWAALGTAAWHVMAQLPSWPQWKHGLDACLVILVGLCAQCASLLALLQVGLELPIPFVLHQAQFHVGHQLVLVVESVWYFLGTQACWQHYVFMAFQKNVKVGKGAILFISMGIMFLRE